MLRMGVVSAVSILALTSERTSDNMRTRPGARRARTKEGGKNERGEGEKTMKERVSEERKEKRSRRPRSKTSCWITALEKQCEAE